MRSLTVKRRESFVGCAMKLKVYVEDYSSHDLVINDIPLRKLGDIKNGEQKAFEVDDTPARIYVIADKLSKGYCNEYYTLPAGSEDVYLEGACKYNPFNGNAFRFDNNNSEEVIKNRKKNIRKGAIVLAVCCVVGFIFSLIIGFNSYEPDVAGKIFSADGMSITLTDEFKKTSFDTYNIVIASEEVVVFGLKEDFSLFEGFEGYSTKEYAELVIQNNELEATEVTESDGSTCFTYDLVNPQDSTDYLYYAYTFKTDDAFWLVQFLLEAENSEKYNDAIKGWVSTITFDSVNT